MQLTATKAVLAWGVFSVFTACAAEQAEPIIGSGNLAARTVQVNAVEKLHVVLPFDTLVVRGEKGQISVRAEDNVLDQIVVRERAASDWEVSAPMDLAFEQQKEVRIEVPFVDMVRVACTESVRFETEPAELLLEKWR